MKKIIFIFLLSQIVFAQKLTKDNLLSKMSDEICTEMKTKKVDKNNFELTLGIVMMKSITNNKQNVERFYGDKMYGENGILEKIGEDLGETMISKCPEMFEKLNDIGALDKYIEDEIVANDIDTSSEHIDKKSPMITGSFSGTKIDGFYNIQVTEDSGKINKLILLEKFENSFLLTDDILKLNDKVEILYYETELFDSKLKLFVNAKIITDIIKI